MIVTSKENSNVVINTQEQKRKNYSIIELITIASAYAFSFYLIGLIILHQNIPFLDDNVSLESTTELD